jgi:hypothetical protein
VASRHSLSVLIQATNCIMLCTPASQYTLLCMHADTYMSECLHMLQPSLHSGPERFALSGERSGSFTKIISVSYVSSQHCSIARMCCLHMLQQHGTYLQPCLHCVTLPYLLPHLYKYINACSCITPAAASCMLYTPATYCTYMLLPYTYYHSCLSINNAIAFAATKIK